MKIIEASLNDGKMCSQLLNFIKIAKAPEMAVADCMALAQVMAWLNELVKQLAGELQAQSKPKAPVPAMILPVPKKKKAKK